MHPSPLLARRLTATFVAALALAACGAGEGDAGADDPVAVESEDPSPASDETIPAAGSTGTDADEPDGTASADGTTPSPVLAATATAPDGSVFTIADSLGTPVLVETFATWCSSCRSQLMSTQAAAEAAGDDAVFLALSVEVDLDPSTLAQYATDNGFEDIRFGVLDPEALVALQQQYGGTVLVPPSTPKFRVDPQGALSELSTGPESSQEILATLGL